MTITDDDLAAGVPFYVGLVLVEALRNAPELAGATVIDNPVRSATLGDDGVRVVFYEDSVDRAKENAQAPKARSFVFNLCTINRSEAARLGAHRDHRSAIAAIRRALSQLQGSVWATSRLRELDTTYRLEAIDVGGALVLTSFSLDYRDPL